MWRLPQRRDCERPNEMPIMHTDSSTLAVKTDGLTRMFGDFRAVDAVHLRVKKGCFYGFLGPNGAGKSTTIKMLTGLLAPTFGSVQILEHTLKGTSADLHIKRRGGVVPEDLALYDHITSQEYLAFIGRLYGVEENEMHARMDSLPVLMKLDGHESKLSMEFSHGMKKKLVMAAALIGNPELLFLDEPFEGVDAVSASILRETLQQFVRRGGSIFLTSHVLEIVERLCTHVAIIDKGAIVHETSMNQLDSSLEEHFLKVVGQAKTAAAWPGWKAQPVRENPRNELAPTPSNPPAPLATQPQRLSPSERILRSCLRHPSRPFLPRRCRRNNRSVFIGKQPIPCRRP